MLKLFGNHRWWVLPLGAAFLAFSFQPLSGGVENFAYNRLSKLMPAAQVDSRTVIVTLDDVQPGAVYPYQKLARLLDQFSKARTSAIGLALDLSLTQTTVDEQTRDVLLSRLSRSQRNRARPYLEPDLALLGAIRKARGVVLMLPTTADALAVSGPLQVAGSGEQNGISSSVLPWLLPPITKPTVNPLPRQEFISQAAAAPLEFAQAGQNVATVPLAKNIGGEYLPGFEMLLAARARGMNTGDLLVIAGKGIKTPRGYFGTDAGLRAYPRLPDQVDQIPRYSATEILNGSVSNRVLRGRVALVTSGSGEDGMSRMLSLPGGAMASQAVWKAHAINALLDRSFVASPYWATGLQRTALLLVAVYLLLLPAILRGRAGLIVAGVLILLIMNVSVFMLVLKNIWLPLSLPVLLLLLGQALVWGHQEVMKRVNHVVAVRDKALLELATSLRHQGQLDKARQYLSDCSPTNASRQGWYELALELERRRQFPKALEIYQAIARQDSRFRDVAKRIARHKPGAKGQPLNASGIAGKAKASLVVDDPSVERPLLGRYELERELGRGAMGTVYLGRDPRIGRTVAIKTLALSEEFESADLKEVHRRFFREAETAGRLDHPNIVTVYDAGEEHDLAYIAMDYIEGDSLDKHIQGETLLPIEEVFSIGVQIAEALAYAHEKNVVHRDIKPGNMIYNPDTGIVKVTDFGIAHLTDNSKTRTGTVLGSPYYMSPEQIAGEKVNGKADQFSLAVSLYQLFSGELPFDGDSLANLMYKITNDKPVSVRKIREDLPACLTRILNKAMEKDPRKRYTDDDAMAEALQRCAEQSGYA